VFSDHGEAVAFAIERAKKDLGDYMERNRVRKYDTRVEVRDITYSEWGERKVAGTVVSVSAEES
jgi:hypothetical protein